MKRIASLVYYIMFYMIVQELLYMISIREISISSAHTNTICMRFCDRKNHILNSTANVIDKLRKISENGHFQTLFPKRIKGFSKGVYYPIFLQRIACLVVRPCAVYKHAWCNRLYRRVAKRVPKTKVWLFLLASSGLQKNSCNVDMHFGNFPDNSVKIGNDKKRFGRLP